MRGRHVDAIEPITQRSCSFVSALGLN